MTDSPEKRRVVILGGYGVFGGKLAVSLLLNPCFDVLVAGRSLEKAEAFCARHGGTPVRLDRDAADFPAILATLSPFVTVDAAGPFQAYDGNPYVVAAAAVAAGSHYLDLSDDAEFTAGIQSLDASSRASGLAVLSGVSSVPALSSVAVESLRTDFRRLDLIESIILPGNRAPRGLSVIRAILAQVGRPLTVFRDGAAETVPGWSGLSRRRLGPGGKDGLPPRWSSFIGAPDLALFPDHYGARTVLFRAGLELSPMHLGLWLLSWPVRLGLIRSLEPAAKALQWAADRLEPFGTDRGGMEVAISGLGTDGLPLTRRWTLIAEAGDGPHIPAVAASILCRRLSEDGVPPGARACLGAFTLDDINQATRHLSVRTFTGTLEQPVLFQQALGSEFKVLPDPVRALHTVFDRRRWSGRAKVTRGRSLGGNLVCRVVGFPPEGEDTPVKVTIEKRGDREIWNRSFGDRTFRSILKLSGSEGTGLVNERFGPVSFDIALERRDDGLHYPVKRGWLLGLPVPKWLLPTSEATETHQDGRFRFDVKISLPVFGLLVHYQGWLTPEHPTEQQGTRRADRKDPVPEKSS
ncbi:SDR family oxidoreductase [Roseibium aggregatum]|uniref:DUF4166 domain-containing protein n=1 Tax=Roseibium aggregatum TaxID=187304 RepID=A0A939EGZ4_9HYPH|nr:SDR family oxidoreductase [Roseibium aggregatum]MBN9671560.1 DUF4166 domain-containing protein [Roseibium aggregatum]